MEDFYKNITSQNNSYDYINMNFDYEDYREKAAFILDVVTVIIIGISLLLTLVAIYALYCQIRNDQVAPIHVINLLISDIIQLCCLMVDVTTTDHDIINGISSIIYLYSLLVSAGFMVCIALERYLFIAHPLWYRFRRTIKIYVGVCVLVWVLPLVLTAIFIFWVTDENFSIILGVFFLLPLPLFIFFLVGTLKALSASTSVPSDEKRRIVAVLVLVLLIYTLLFLPSIILLLAERYVFTITLDSLSYVFVQFSPLADLTLYVFMRKGIIDRFLSSVCCCRMDSDVMFWSTCSGSGSKMAV